MEHLEPKTGEKEKESDCGKEAVGFEADKEGRGERK